MATIKQIMATCRHCTYNSKITDSSIPKTESKMIISKLGFLIKRIIVITYILSVASNPIII